MALGVHAFGGKAELVTEGPGERLVGAVTRIESHRQNVWRALGSIRAASVRRRLRR